MIDYNGVAKQVGKKNGKEEFEQRFFNKQIKQWVEMREDTYFF